MGALAAARGGVSGKAAGACNEAGAMAGSARLLAAAPPLAKVPWARSRKSSHGVPPRARWPSSPCRTHLAQQAGHCWKLLPHCVGAAAEKCQYLSRQDSCSVSVACGRLFL